MAKKKEVAVKVIERNLAPTLTASRSLEINSPEAMQEATAILSRLNKWLKDVEADEKTLTQPANDILKEVRARYRPIKSELSSEIESVRAKMSTYQTALLAERKVEEEAIAGRIGAGKGYLKVETAESKINALPSIDSSIASQEGSVAFRTTKKFEVVDIALLPIIYHLADEVAIRKAMKEGIELAGVRYWNEQTPVNSLE